MGYNPVSDRMISIKLNSYPVKTTIIQVYAPTTRADEDEMDEFYGKLQDLVDNVPRKFGLGDRNDAGERLLEFCGSNEMVITNMWFEQPKRWPYTWAMEKHNGEHRNQIDYIPIRKRWQSSVQSAKTLPGADCGSDHELLVAEIRLKLKRLKKTDTINRYDLDSIPEKFSVEVKNRFAALDLVEREPDDLWQEEIRVKERWKEYTEELHKRDENITLTFEEKNYEQELSVTKEEVEKVVKELTNCKSAGIDDIPIKLFKKLNEEGIFVLTRICQLIWKTGTWPKQWKQSIYIRIQKSGDNGICANNKNNRTHISC
eukprot:gene1894-2149_t